MAANCRNIPITLINPALGVIAWFVNYPDSSHSLAFPLWIISGLPVIEAPLQAIKDSLGEPKIVFGFRNKAKKSGSLANLEFISSYFPAIPITCNDNSFF